MAVPGQCGPHLPAWLLHNPPDSAPDCRDTEMRCKLCSRKPDTHRRVCTKGALKRFLRSRKIFYRSIKIFERRLRQEQVITVSEVATAGAKYGPGCK